MIISKVTAFDLSNAVNLRELMNPGQASTYQRYVLFCAWVFKAVCSCYPLGMFQNRDIQIISLRKCFAVRRKKLETITGKKSTSTQELFYIFW